MILGQTLTTNPMALFFAIGMGAALFIYCYILKHNYLEEDKSDAIQNSRKGLELLEKKVRDSWLLISRHNRLYLGALIVCYVAQKFGQISGHPIFSSSIVIAFTYLIAFASSFKHLMNGRELDQQIVACLSRGIQMEKEHPEWKVEFFRQFVNEICQGYGMFSLIFFRILILAWLLFSVIYFGILSQFSSVISVFSMAELSIAIFIPIAVFLWKIGCHPYYLLRTKNKEIIA